MRNAGISKMYVAVSYPINEGAQLYSQEQMGYLVKWKGYDSAENSWVKEEDAGYALV
jgi:hypothetical protein